MSPSHDDRVRRNYDPIVVKQSEVLEKVYGLIRKWRKTHRGLEENLYPSDYGDCANELENILDWKEKG